MYVYNDSNANTFFTGTFGSIGGHMSQTHSRSHVTNPFSVTCHNPPALPQTMKIAPLSISHYAARKLK